MRAVAAARGGHGSHFFFYPDTRVLPGVFFLKPHWLRARVVVFFFTRITPGSLFSLGPGNTGVVVVVVVVVVYSKGVGGGCGGGFFYF